MRKWLAWGVGTLVLVLMVLVAAAFALVDTPAVQAELQRRLSELPQGKVTWQALDVGLLPPHAELRQVRVEIPDKMSAAVEDLQIYLRLWPLLRGSPEISSVTVTQPRVRVTPSEAKESTAPIDAVALY